MSVKSSYYTKEGLKKLKKELMSLHAQRPKIHQEIMDARTKGDLSENSEFDAAKDAQRFLESRIMELESALSSAKIIDNSMKETSIVTILKKVKVKNKKNESILTYELVPPSESNLKEKKISVASPIGRGLLGKKVGENVEILIPIGKLNFEIMEISN